MDVAIWIHEVHVIGSVVILPLEFQRLGFGELEYFAKGKVELIEARAAQGIMVNQALPPDPLRVNKCGRIEPMKSVLIRNVGIAHLIGSSLIEVCVQKRVVGSYRERQSGLKAADAAEIPATENRVHGLADSIPPVAPTPIRQLPCV